VVVNEVRALLPDVLPVVAGEGEVVAAEVSVVVAVEAARWLEEPQPQTPTAAVRHSTPIELLYR